MTDIILSADQSNNLTALLNKVHKESKAAFTLLNHSAGNTIAQAGEYPGPDSSMFSVLASASYASISSIISSLGDEMFDSMNLRCKKWTLCILPINMSVQLVFIFESTNLPTLTKTLISEWKTNLEEVIHFFGQTSHIRQ